jgi:hypothetical protein
LQGGTAANHCDKMSCLICLRCQVFRLAVLSSASSAEHVAAADAEHLVLKGLMLLTYDANTVKNSML